MANKAYQRVYTQLEAITKATVSLHAKGVANDELAVVNGRLAQVVKTKGDMRSMSTGIRLAAGCMVRCPDEMKVEVPGSG